MGMDKYNTFLVAAECETFYQAAEKLYTTAATVSKHIASLEKEFGTVLFERHPGGVRLTKEGESRIALVQQMMAAYKSFLNPEGQIEGQELRVYTAKPPSRFGLSGLVREFSLERPDIKLWIEEKHLVTSALLKGACELGFIEPSIFNPEQLQGLTVPLGKIGAVLPGKHPLAGSDRISLSDLCNEIFILSNYYIGDYQVNVELFKDCAFEPNIRQTVSRDDSVLFYVENNQGVSLFTYETLSHFRFGNLAFVPLTEELYRYAVLARVGNRHHSASAIALWDYIRQRSTAADSSLQSVNAGSEVAPVEY